MIVKVVVPKDLDEDGRAMVKKLESRFPVEAGRICGGEGQEMVNCE